MPKTRIKNSQIENDTPYVSAKIGSETASGNKSFNTVSSSGFTIASNRLTAQIAGRYFISVDQLISTSGSALYYAINKNGVTISYAYRNGSVTTTDVHTACIVDLVAGDYIEINQSAAITSSWSGTHSNFEIFKI